MAHKHVFVACVNDPDAADVYFFAGRTKRDLNRKLLKYVRDHWENTENQAGPVADLKATEIVEIYFQHTPEMLWWGKTDF